MSPKIRFCRHCNSLMRLRAIPPDNRPKWIHAVEGAGKRCRAMQKLKAQETT